MKYIIAKQNKKFSRRIQSNSIWRCQYKKILINYHLNIYYKKKQYLLFKKKNLKFLWIKYNFFFHSIEKFETTN